MENELKARLNLLENKICELEEPSAIMYCRPGAEDYEHLADFLNDVYIELQQIKCQVSQLLQLHQQTQAEQEPVIHHLHR